jgi:hypothetical protein
MLDGGWTEGVLALVAAASGAVPALGAGCANAAPQTSGQTNAVKQRKLFFMCRFYGFYQRNHVCGADQ